MSLLLYLMMMGVWVALVELALHHWRRGQYERIAATRREAEAALQDARIARLRAHGQPQAQRRAS